MDTSIVKYQTFEDTYRDDIDTWIANMYFSIARKDTLANPYTVQLVLDDDTKERHRKHTAIDNSDETAGSSNPKHHDSKSIKNTETALEPIKLIDTTAALSPRNDEHEKQEDKTMNDEDILLDKKRELIEDILKSDSDESSDDETEIKIDKDKKTAEMRKPEDYLQYSFNIPRNIDTEVNPWDKVAYVVDEAVSDLGVNNIVSVDFWIALCILLMAIWIRNYLHTFGAWAFLNLAGIPVTTFKPLLYFFNLLTI